MGGSRGLRSAAVIVVASGLLVDGGARADAPHAPSEVAEHAPPIDDLVERPVEAIAGGIPQSSPSVLLAGMNPVTPARLLDTRDGTGVAAPGPVGEGAFIELVVTGRGGVPISGVDAVALNMTVTEPTQPSFLTVWPAGADRPLASSLNMVGGQTVANLVFAKVGAGGAVSIFNRFGATHVVADVVAWSGSEEFLRSLTPSRVLDTRDGTGGVAGAVGPETSIDLTVTGTPAVPATGVDAVVLNVTVTEATAPSYVTVWPAGAPRPLASSLNTGAGETNPNMVISKVGDGGRISFYNHAGHAHLVADIVGWIPIGGAYTAINPTRVLDTREEFGTYGTFVISPMFGPILRPRALDFERRIRPTETVQLQIAHPLDLPAGATSVMLNLTGVEATAPTFVTAWGYGRPRPLASSLNLATGATRPNLVVAEIGDDGYVSLYNHEGLVHLVADVVGYFEARNVQDAPDTVAGPQLHVVHVVPSDAPPTYGDAELQHTLSVAETWLAAHGGRGMRFDTVAGVPEISRLHIGKTRAQILEASQAWSFDFEDWLIADGFGMHGKAYIVYVDGVDTGGLCGLGGGQFARIFTSACAAELSGTTPNATGTWETLRAARVTVHELIHVLGAVRDCAPGYSFGGHVADEADVMHSTDTVMYTGELAAGHASVIDQGNDDYWGQGDSTCQGEDWPDVSLSAFLDAP